jgi:hypothetical protein
MSNRKGTVRGKEMEVTFANFSPARQGLEGIYQIGATTGYPDGVAREIAVAFNYTLAEQPDVQNLGGLIREVGPAKTLQDNISRVQERLGTSVGAVEVAQDWAERSGLLVPMSRMYMTAENFSESEAIDLAVVTSGVRNWMERRADQVKDRIPHRVLLAGGSRVMNPSEGPGVEAGMTEADYMRDVIAPRLGRQSIEQEVLAVDSEIGNEVMAAVAVRAGELVDLRHDRVALISNAPAGPQNGGQFLRAVQEVAGSDVDIAIISDGFPIGDGTQPAATHQNPFSAVGQLARNLRGFTEHSR